VKITGTAKLKKQLKQVAPNVREEIETSTKRAAKRFANFARKVAPQGATGETKKVINHQVNISKHGVFGFVNFAQPTKQSAVRQASINYGRVEGDRGTTSGYQYIQTTRSFIGDKYKRAVKNAVSRGVKRASNV
jgi:hypothetical protein